MSLWQYRFLDLESPTKLWNSMTGTVAEQPLPEYDHFADEYYPQAGFPDDVPPVAAAGTAATTSTRSTSFSAVYGCVAEATITVLFCKSWTTSKNMYVQQLATSQ
jgi:hypothetical protein